MDRSNNARSNDRLRQERIGRNWRQRDVAEHLGTTVVTVKRWERGHQQPSSYFRTKLCVLFGKSAEELGLGSDDEPEEAVLWGIPFLRNLFFTGRDLVLEQLHAALTGEPTMAALTRSYALHGLGGIGKTQLAIEYAYRYRHAYQALFWVEAETYSSLTASFVRLATLLELPEETAEDHSKVVAAVLRWFNRHTGWLLIFDNVEDLALIKPFLPASDQGALLLTTRLQSLGTLAQTIPLSPMTEQEGVNFLLTRIKHRDREGRQRPNDPQEEAAAYGIVAEMGGLPLALEQVGAYIDATQCRLSDYLRLFQAAQHRLLDEHEGSSDHPLSVSRTFMLAYERVEQRDPLAAALLSVCAFLAPDAIPETLFLGGAYPSGAAFEMMATDPLAFPKAIKVLLSYSLIQRHPGTQTLSLHRLVQAVLRQRMSEAEQEQWQQCALHLLSAAFPEESYEVWGQESREIWKRCERLLPHVLVCVPLIPESGEDLELASLLQKAASYLHERGQQHEQANVLGQRALRIRLQVLGEEHPDVATSLYELGQLYGYMGRYEEAEALYQRALRIYELVLGEERSEAARVFSELAHLSWKQGRYEKAEALQQQALSIWRQTLGPEHPGMARALSRLAVIYHNQGRYEEAEALYEQALRIYELASGPKPPNEAGTLNNLAELYQSQGRYEKAKSLYWRALSIWEQALGPEHPNLAMAFCNLADVFCKQGKYEEAQPLYKRALSIWEQALGPEHPNLAMVLNGMANLFRDQGKYEQARSFYQRALTLRQQYLSPQHPYIAETLHDLARCHRLQHQISDALMLYQQALTIREQTYGSQHPKTQETRQALTELLQEMH